MIANILKKVFGSRNDRLLKQYRAVVNRINALESGLQTLDDAALAGKTAEFRARVEKGERLDSLLSALPGKSQCTLQSLLRFYS